MTEKTLERILVCMNWEESERGWGERPDGISLHLTEEDYKSFVKDYWSTMPDTVPNEYSRPAIFQEPYKVRASEEMYQKVKDRKNGIRVYNTRELLEKKELMKYD